MHEKISNDIDLNDIPVQALRPRTLRRLGCMLDRIKILPSPSPWCLPRDYRGLAELMNVSTIQGWLGEKPVEKLITEFGPRNELTLGKLQTYFEKIDRYDVLDDTSHMFLEDAVEYENKKNCLVQTQAKYQFYETEKEILTLDDIIRNQNGTGPQKYNAFILYVDDDRPFAEELVIRMERDYGLKICDKDRDLIAGLTFEHSAIMKLISERCERLLVILSENFVRSDRHSFFLKYAQAISCEQGHRKVIPCIYKKCNLPFEYRTYVFLDYERYSRNGLCDFWSKLNASILPTELVTPSITKNNTTKGVVIDDITLEEKKTNNQTLQSTKIISKEKNCFPNAAINMEKNYFSNTTTEVKSKDLTKENGLVQNNEPTIISNEKKKSRTLTKNLINLLPGMKKIKTKKSTKQQVACAL